MDMETLRALNLKNAVDEGIEDIKREEEEIDLTECVNLKSSPDNKKQSINKGKLQELITNKYYIVSYAGIPYIYKDGYYKDGRETINKEICNVALKQNITGNIRKEIADITALIVGLTSEEDYPFNKYPNAINIKNGVLIFDKDKGIFDLFKHSSEYRFLYKLPMVYNPNAPDTIYEECFKSWTDEPEVLVQIFAQGIIQVFNSAPFKKAYLLQGDPHAGKSTYLTLLYKMFEGFYSNVPLQDLSKEFNIACLENKMFNVADDLADIPMTETGTFKNLTGNYMHRIRNLHVQGRVGRVNAVHIYTCNVPPMTDKRSMLDSAFWERWQYVLFNNCFPVNERFTDNIYTDDNISGVFNRVLEMICKIFANNELPYKQDMEAVRERWSLATDCIHQYLEENIDQSNSTLYVDRQELLEAITRWAMSTDRDMRKIPNTINALTAALTKHGIESMQKRHAGGKSVVYAIHGSWNTGSKFVAKTYKSETEQIRMI